VTAQATTIHTSLVAALTAAGLVDTISGETEYTVFAPSDQAFTDAGIDLDSFDTPEKIDTLKDILLYHVVAGTVMSTDLASGQSQVTAANGDTLDIDVSADGVSVGAEMATVVLADVPASNGVIHVIDKVLMPPADLPTCDYTVGIGLSGMAFNPSVVEVNVGQTVCWQWTDATMAHNVKEVDGDRSNVFVDGGVSSGTSQTTVDFRYTFTEDNSTFYYVCEPHILAEMYGKVIVGDGGVTVVDDSNTVDTDDESDSNTPGFVSVTAVIALMGALLFARNKNE
jgi:plastocyanin